MEHKGVIFSLVKTADPQIWRWEFQVGGRTRTGTTQARLELLAVRRVQSHIDRELKQIERGPE